MGFVAPKVRGKESTPGSVKLSAKSFVMESRGSAANLWPRAGLGPFGASPCPPSVPSSWSGLEFPPARDPISGGDGVGTSTNRCFGFPDETERGFVLAATRASPDFRWMLNLRPVEIVEGGAAVDEVVALAALTVADVVLFSFDLNARSYSQPTCQ